MEGKNEDNIIVFLMIGETNMSMMDKFLNVINLNNDFYDNENDASLVNYITFLKYKFLFIL